MALCRCLFSLFNSKDIRPVVALPDEFSPSLNSRGTQKGAPALSLAAAAVRGSVGSDGSWGGPAAGGASGRKGWQRRSAGCAGPRRLSRSHRYITPLCRHGAAAMEPVSPVSADLSPATLQTVLELQRAFNAGVEIGREEGLSEAEQCFEICSEDDPRGARGARDYPALQRFKVKNPVEPLEDVLPTDE